MAFDAGSSYWLQAILLIVTNILIYGLLESWRHYPHIWGYISIIVNLAITPLALISDGTIFIKIKFLIIAPIIIIVTFVRLAYIPCNENTPKWKLLLHKLSDWFIKYLCCQCCEMIQPVNTTKFLEYFFWIVQFVNINSATITELLEGSYLNPICGIILSFTAPVPGKLLYDRNGYYVENVPLYDAVAPINILWPITFTMWDWLFVWEGGGQFVLVATWHLIPNLIRAIIGKRYELYLESRVVCLTLFVWIGLPLNNDALDWFLNANNFPWIRDIALNHTYVLRIIGGINIALASIHAVIFVYNIIQERKETAKKNVETELENTEQQQPLNVGSDVTV